MDAIRIIALVVLWTTAVYQLFAIAMYPLSLNSRIPLLFGTLLIVFLLHTVFKSEH